MRYYITETSYERTDFFKKNAVNGYDQSSFPALYPGTGIYFLSNMEPIFTGVAAIIEKLKTRYFSKLHFCYLEDLLGKLTLVDRSRPGTSNYNWILLP